MMAISALAGGISFATPAMAQFKLGKVLGAAKDIAEAESLSDEQLKSNFSQIAAEYDRLNPVAGPKDPYGKRIAALSKGLEKHDGLDLDIKAYLVSDINAFAMADGTIRVFAGLMDKFTDDEIRYVIGHEIGHVHAGHSRKRMQAALRASALRKGASAAGGTAGKIADGELGGIIQQVMVAQHSQKNENEADEYAMGFMKGKGYDAKACVTALDKLAELGGGGDGLPWLQTHPSPGARANRMRKLV
ncbi:MAG: M48 family metalloprotease [Sphingomonadales bacterium]|nr:M48 family metalloprotease [Sphingomonadales bacterium]